MDRKWMVLPAVALPLALGGFALANTQEKDAEKPQQVAQEAGYTCPVTGEELPCPNCCVLNKNQ